jgi:hypothetical protein
MARPPNADMHGSQDPFHRTKQISENRAASSQQPKMKEIDDEALRINLMIEVERKVSRTNLHSPHLTKSYAHLWLISS